jgi:redox-sensitive bicupin YhaK (pirin superfamily)
VSSYRTAPLAAGPWPAQDPFLFCVHHLDAYPRANGAFGPASSLAGRQLGQDFAGRDGWNMYHGQRIPGFPPHPHRGFETITVMRRGVVDHADSLGAAARFGAGDVQWMTAGKGIVHSEMFPLLDAGADNPLELFQIWINLPASDKMAEPHFSMSWSEDVPRRVVGDGSNGEVTLTVVAGALGDAVPPPPPPRSWAARPDAHVALWVLTMSPGARWELPAVPPGVRRTLQVFRGAGVALDGESFAARTSVQWAHERAVALQNGPQPSELLLLQGRPIAEPVASYGPFVMNDRRQIEQAFDDYRRTRFGGWPWPSDEVVHGAELRRFARYPDGTTRTPRG